MSDPSAAAREAARLRNGQFGEQPHTDPGDVLTADPAADIRRTLTVAQWASSDSRDIYHEALQHEAVAAIALAATLARHENPAAKYLTVDRYEDDPVDDFGGYSIMVGNEVFNAFGDPVGSTEPFSASSAWSTYGQGWMAAVTTAATVYADDHEVVDIDEMLKLAETLPADMDRARRQCSRPSLARARTDIAIEDAMAGQQKVQWLAENGEVRTGTVRGAVWTADGQIAGHNIDPRDGHIRITTSTGFELFMPWEAAAQLHERHEMAFQGR